MGKKSDKNSAFLADNPICCFCGGSTLSEEIDHVPARVIFDQRQWPEGYAFPACVRCNRATRHDEQVVAMLCRVYPDSTTPEGQKEISERLRAVAANYPGLLEEMNPSIRQVRSAIKKYQIDKPQGSTTTDMPFLFVGGPLVEKAVKRFGRKLFLALYYLHTGNILPCEGGVAIRWFSNLQMEAGELPGELAQVLQSIPSVERSRKDLSEQFFYRYVLMENRLGGGFLAGFRQSFAILGLVFADRSDLPAIGDKEWLSPFGCERP